MQPRRRTESSRHDEELQPMLQAEEEREAEDELPEEGWEVEPEIEYQNRIPWKSITLAIALFIMGSVGLVLGILTLMGSIASLKDRGLPLIILGSICFLPGSYMTFIAYKSWRGAPGYSFDDIPEY